MTDLSQLPGRARDLGRFSGPEWGVDPLRELTSVIAQFAVFMVGFDLFVAKGVNASVVLALVLLPLWAPVLRRYTSAAWVTGGILAAIASGYVLALRSSVTHQIDPDNATAWVGVVLAGLAAYLLVLWAREFVPLRRVALLFGLGQLAAAFVFTGRDWKFDLSLPAAFILLGLVDRSRSRLVPAAAITALGVIGVMAGARSYFAFALIAAVLTIWQGLGRPPAEARRVRRWAPILLLAALGAAVYFSLSSMLAAGAFGAELQERSTAQIEATGSLIAGGRPEWAATRELVRTNPPGYGIGVVPSWADLQAGKSGLASINVDAGGYTNNYMFGGAFELHSILSDLWVNTGVLGVAVGIGLLLTLLRNLSFLLAARRADTIVIFTTCLAVWSLLFGPLFTDWLLVMVALGLSSLERTDRSAGPSTSG